MRIRTAADALARIGRESFRDFLPRDDYSPGHQLRLILLAVLIGAAVGYGAWAFRLALAGTQYLFFGEASEYLVEAVRGLPWWQVVGAPTLGGLLVALFIRYLVPGARPYGVADVIEAGMYNQGQMSLRTGLAAAAANVLSLGCGASAGREGPVVHLGGAIAGFVAKRMHLDRLDGHSILACGVAAAVAASFNAPIAGVIFAHEVVLGHYALRALAPVVVSSVIGTLVTRIHIADAAAFQIPHYEILSFWEFPAFMALGVVCGFMALVFFWSVSVSRDLFQASRIPPLLWPACAGLLVGSIALVFPEVLGVGYEATDNALKQAYSIHFLILLAAAKMAATAITLGAGFGGGVFSPTLFMGAMTGGTFGLIAAWMFPELAAEHGLYAIVGMGAMAAAVLGAPISTTLIVFELTGDYRVTIALMVAVVVATLIGRQFRYRSFFHWQLARRSVELVEADEAMLSAQRVGDVMTRDFEAIRADAPLSELREAYRSSSARAWFVVDDGGRLLGTLGAIDIRRTLLDPDVDLATPVNTLGVSTGPTLQPDMSLNRAMQVFRGSGHRSLPVLDKGDAQRPVGVVHFRDLLAVHNQALIRAQQEAN